MPKKRWRYMGFDESNHGRFPEVFVTTYSNIDKDIYKQSFKKRRKSHHGLKKKLNKRGYSFLLLDRTQHGRLKPHKIKGAVISSLLYEEDLERLRLFIDGELRYLERDFIKGALNDVLGLERSCIEINSGVGLDQKLKIVNIADELANYIFRRMTPEKQSEDPGSRQLLEYFL